MTGSPLSFRFRTSGRLGPRGLRVVDVIRDGLPIATITPTRVGLRISSAYLMRISSAYLGQPRYSAARLPTVELELAHDG